MKKLKIIFLMIIMAGFASSAVNAQAIVIKDGMWIFPAPSGPVEAYDVQEVYTPDGSILHRANFQFPMDDPWIVEAKENGNYIIYGWTVSTPYGIAPLEIHVYKNGRVKVMGHLEMEPDPDD